VPEVPGVGGMHPAISGTNTRAPAFREWRIFLMAATNISSLKKIEPLAPSYFDLLQL
jgi:hypothetical protein